MGDRADEAAFDLLDHLVCLSVPDRKASMAWMQHAPLGMPLVDLVQPTLLVELGASTGSSYFTYCHVVDELRLGRRCFAVAPRCGCNSDDVFEDLKKQHDPRYGAFSTLLRSTVEDAVRRFAGRSIDLLRINRSGAYQAARHDVGAWLPKMSRCGVVVLHDANEGEIDAAVWRLWKVLAANYPPFEARHGYGPGVVSVGSETPSGMQAVLSMSAERALAPRETLYALGQRVEGIQRAEALWEQILVTERQARVQAAELAAKHEAHRMEAARQVAQAHQLAADHIIEASLQVARVRKLAEDRFRSEREELTARFQTDLDSLREQLTTATAQLAAAHGELAWLNSSRGVRAVKLARASRALLSQRGPLALARRVGGWLLGKRGYHLSDSLAVGATSASPTGTRGVQILD